MLVLPPDGYEWPSPWVPIRDESACLTNPRIMSEMFGDTAPEPFLAAELRREVRLGHPLHGRECRAIGQATDDPNEFVFATDHPDFPIAFVHLTWSVETSPTFPYTVGYSSWDAFRREWSKATAPDVAVDSPRD